MDERKDEHIMATRKKTFETDIDAAIAAYTETLVSIEEGFDPTTGEYVAVHDGKEYRCPTRLSLGVFDDIDDDRTDFEQFKIMFPEVYESLRDLPYVTVTTIIKGYFVVFEKVQKASLGKLADSPESGETTGQP